MARPYIDRSVIASNATFQSPAVAPWLGAPTKQVPSLTNWQNGLGATNAEPTAEETNYILNQLGVWRNYIDTVEDLNTIGFGASAAIRLQGVMGRFSSGVHHAIGSGLNSGNNFVTVWVSTDSGHNWAVGYTSPGVATSVDVIHRLTGRFAVDPASGKFCALATRNVSPYTLRGNILYYNAGGSISTTTVHEKAISGSDNARQVRWLPGVGFLIGGLAATASAIVLVDAVTFAMTTGYLDVIRTASAPIHCIAVGAANVLCADTDGFFWRAPVSFAGGFVQVNAAPLLPHIIALEYVTGYECFWALTWTNVVGYQAYRSADGSTWDPVGSPLTTSAGVLAVSDDTTYPSDWVGVATHGSVVHLLLGGFSGGGTLYQRAVSRDLGASWIILGPPNLAGVDGNGDPRYQTIHSASTEDLVTLIAASHLEGPEVGPVTSTGKSSSVQRTLRLG